MLERRTKYFEVPL